MKRVLAILAVLGALPAFAETIVDRAQIPVRVATNGNVRYVSTLAPRVPLFLLPQIIPGFGSGGGGGGITIGTTAVTDGTAGENLYVGAGAVVQQSPFTVASDIAPTAMYLAGEHAFAAATGGNQTGGALSLYGGIGSRLYTVVDYTALALDTATITVNGTATVRTEGTNWTAATSNAATATSLATTIDAIAGVGATASGDTVRVTADNGTYSLTIATGDAVNLTIVQGTDGAYTLGPAIVQGRFGILRAGAAAKLEITNLTSTDDILRLYDNTSLVLAVEDGGWFTFTGQVRLASQYFLNLAGGIADGPGFVNRTEATPDAPYMATKADTSNSWHVAEGGDVSVDLANGACGTVVCTDPTLIVHSAVQNTTSYNASATWGFARKYHVTLTESVATKAMQIPVAAEVGTGGQFWYAIYATDGATPQTRFGRVIFALTADGAVETCTLGTPEEVVSSPVGTLTVTVACDVATPANAADITLSAVSSLLQTTLEAYVSVDLIGPGEPKRP